MKRGLPLSMRILLWCVLNLLLLAAVFLGLFRGQLGLGLDSLIAGGAGDRLQSIADSLSGELSHTPETEWDEVLERTAVNFRVRPQLVKLDGRWWAGEHRDLPPDVLKRLAEPRFNNRQPLDGNRGFFGPRHRGGGGGIGIGGGPGTGNGFGPGLGLDGRPLRGGGEGGGGRRFNGGGPPDSLLPGGGPPEGRGQLDGRPPRPRSFEEHFAEYLRESSASPPPDAAGDVDPDQTQNPSSKPPPAAGQASAPQPAPEPALGPPPAPAPAPLPPAIEPSQADSPPPPPFQVQAGPEAGPPPGARPPPPTPVGRPRFLVRAGDPPLYWAGVPLIGLADDMGRPAPAVLIAVFDSLTADGWIIDPKPWLMAGFGALLLSILLWFPLVRGITRSIRSMTKATESIAEGKFDSVAAVNRTDELGHLAHSINHLSGRLGHFVNGQRRFLGDIAHELCSPLARMQLGISLLERGGDPATHERVADVREEVEVMTDLVNELLSFSKAGLRSLDTPLEPVPLAGMARHVASREGWSQDLDGGDQEQDRVQIHIPETLRAMADSGLLTRAVSNLVRNALRYAGHAGPVVITAGESAGAVFLTVSDSGPGVPESELEKIFEPFHRPDAARTREAGGSGLGLAIVRSCVHACQGTVSAANQSPTGLAVTIRLAPAPAPARDSED